MSIFSEEPKLPENIPTSNQPVKAAVKPVLRKLTEEISGPSIKRVMEGKSPEKEILNSGDQDEQAEAATQNVLLTEELVYEKWTEMLELLNDRPNLKSTLSQNPILNEDGTLLVEIDNSLQEELIRNNKPRLVAWLKRELHNNAVDLVTEIRLQSSHKIAYTDGEKLEEMIRKNEKLILLKQRFQLDFDEL